MNVDRRMVNGEIDPSEPSQQQIYITSAGGKGTYAYERLIEIFIQSIIFPFSSFVMGCDYRVPVMHNLLNKKFIDELKASATFKEDSFAKEYLGLWQGGSDDSWFNFEKLQQYRKIVNPEKKNLFRENSEGFYYIAVDVARVGVLTSIQVIKVLPGADHFLKKVVFSTGLHDMHFALQSIEIKKLVKAYSPKEVCIDGTGLSKLAPLVSNGY